VVKTRRVSTKIQCASPSFITTLLLLAIQYRVDSALYPRWHAYYVNNRSFENSSESCSLNMGTTHKKHTGQLSVKVLDSELKAYNGIVKTLGKEAEKLKNADPADAKEIAAKQVSSHVCSVMLTATRHWHCCCCCCSVLQRSVSHTHFAFLIHSFIGSETYTVSQKNAHLLFF